MSTDTPFASLPVTHKSACVGPGSIFFALPGARTHGAFYIPEALARGAREIVIDASYELSDELRTLCRQHGATIRTSTALRTDLARESAAAHNHPAQQLICIGITGTKGKTTTSFLLHHILQQTQGTTGLLSTAGNRIGGEEHPAELTTPHADYLHAFLARCHQQRATHVVIETAAQAVTLQRTYGIPFTAIAWLNFSAEHGEFYATPGDYWHAKRALLQQVTPSGFTILPEDAPWKAGCSVFGSTCCSAVPWHPREYTFATAAPTTSASLLTDPQVRCCYESITYTCPRLLGAYNSANLLVAVMIARLLNIAPSAIQQALTSFRGVPGRLQWYPLKQGAYACIDYAHNPASYEALLSALRIHTNQLIIVCGAGGDRDPSRRPAMGRIAANYADTLFLTTDNPRTEDPAAICAEMYEGAAPADRHKIQIELDRERAIQRACSGAQPGAIVAILGKGCDEYQLIQGVRSPFSERAILANL